MRTSTASTKRRLQLLFDVVLLVFALALAVICLQAQTAPASPLLPNGVAYDAAGNLYFADTHRNQVYESSLAGALTIVAGSGIQGFAGDGSSALNAQLNAPQGIAIGPDGTLYIADTGNHRIRAVANGQIATFAGTGIAGYGATELSAPTALAIDATGALLVCDTGNHRIRRIGAGTITTIAGSGTQGFSGDGASALAAQLDTPSGIAVGPDGRIYIADTHNDRIRVIAIGGTITTLAGTGTRGFSGDGSAAAAAQLALPRGLAVTAAGSLVFADSNNQRLRTIDPQGTITTLAGSGVQGSAADASPAATAALDTPRGVSLSLFGSPVVADAGNRQLRESLGNANLYLPAGLVPSRASTVVLTASPISSSGQSTAGVTVTGSAGTPQGSVSLFDGATLVAQTSLAAGTASFPLTSLAAGSHNLSAIYLGDGVNPAAASGVVTIDSGATIVTATANPQTIDYGQAIPALTGTFSGVLPQDTSNVSVNFSTAAAPLSAPGTYAITATLTGSASANYTLVLSPNSGSLRIDQAASLTAEQPLAQGSYVGLPLVLTATVASSTQGTPTGTVTFSDSGTLVATATVSNGIASATYLSPAAGSHSIVASYLGDKNFASSTSQAMTATVGAMPDFTISSSTPTQTVTAGSVATYTFSIAAQPAPFTGVVTLSAGSLPAGTTASFSPPQTVPGNTSATITLSVQTAVAQGSKAAPAASWWTASLLPMWLLLRRRKVSRYVRFALMALALASTGGCGARSISTASLAQQAYTLQIKGTATNLAGSVVVHTASVTLVVQ